MAKQTVENDLNEWSSSMYTLLKSVDDDYTQSCSISVVPEGLKESNEDPAYMPRVVSMGPKFKGSRDDLLLMEEVKLRCTLSLLHRASRDREVRTVLNECSEAIWSLDDRVRASYVADIKLKNAELAQIMLVDGCFLLELLISKGMDAKLPSRYEPPGPAPQVLKDEHVLSDIMLLENQIPILVLHKLSRILFPKVFDENLERRAISINNLALSVWGYPLPRVQITEAAHILDLVHFIVNRKANNSAGGDIHVVGMNHNTLEFKMKRCACRLQAAGVTIKLPDVKDSEISCFRWLCNYFGDLLICLGKCIKRVEENVLPQVENMRGLNFNFEFKDGKLEIAQLHITETTKAKWRNVIAWEHHKNNWKSSSTYEIGDEIPIVGKFTSAALIFDGLICCAADVKLLKDNNIIVDHVKRSDEELEVFFRTMSLGVDHGIVDPSYVQMADDLNKHLTTFFIVRKWKIFWHVFRCFLEWLFNFMTRNYNLVATVLAILSVVQTLYALLDYYLHN